MKIENRLFDNLKTGRTSVGCVVTMSDLVVSELAGDSTWTPSGSSHGLVNTGAEDLVFMALIVNS